MKENTDLIKVSSNGYWTVTDFLWRILEISWIIISPQKWNKTLMKAEEIVWRHDERIHDQFHPMWKMLKQMLREKVEKEY
jgi:hypothetical protein